MLATATHTTTSSPTTVSINPDRPAQDRAPGQRLQSTHARGDAQVGSVIDHVCRSGKWELWQNAEPRLSGFAGLEDALLAWRHDRDERCYQVVAGLAALGSSRGGNDDDAALAVVAMLEDGITQMATSLLSDVCEADDVRIAVWEVVKACEPQIGNRAADHLLRRARQRLTSPAAGLVSRVHTIPVGGFAVHLRTSPTLAAEMEDPVADLVDVLTWARGTGVIVTDEVDLLVELLAAEHEGLGREEAQRLAGERRGVALRTIRRRRDATEARLREAVPAYLAAVS